MTRLLEGASGLDYAAFSDDGRYRYQLGREVARGGRRVARPRRVLFVCLNPSTADHEADDPTVRRCLGFARLWGYDALLVGNLFALRSTDPRALRSASDPVGPDNDAHLRAMAGMAELVVCAWGAGAAHDRAEDVKRLLRYEDTGVDRLRPRQLNCLGRTKQGPPRHPLYVPSTAALEPL